MSRGFAEEHVHNVCKVCDYAIRNEKCPGCGFAFESFSIREHDAEIHRQTIDELKHFIKWFAEKTHYIILNTDDFLIEEYVHCYPLEDIFAEWKQMKGENSDECM